jgi:ribose-phosphate pyrophosphokinase
MSYSRPDSLGILACPGGQEFADEIIHHLRKIYKNKFEKKSKLLARKYGETPEKIIRTINLYRELRSSRILLRGSPDAYRPPSFRIGASFTRFPNGEFKSEILSSVRGLDLFIVQDMENHLPLGFNGSDAVHELTVNDHFFCLLATVDAAIQAGAGSVTLVLPAYPYARQHKRKSREGLTAVRIGQIFERMGADRLITLDIHSREIANGLGRMRMENLHASYQILLKLSELIDLNDPDLVMVAPDTGAVDRNKFYALSLNRPLAMLYKERDYSKVSKDALNNNVTSMKLLGSVEGKTVFMADDLLGTGGTLIKAMKLISSLGAKKIICAVSIPLFSADAIEHFDAAYREGFFHRVIGTNAVRHDQRLLGKEWFLSVDVSELFAQIMYRLHHRQSLTPLLDNRRIIQKLLHSKKS